MGSRDQLRAADADRERYAEQLRAAVGDGRLTLDEMDERLQRVLAAKTFGELDRVVADLPGTVPPQQAQVALSATRVPASRHEDNPRLPRWLAFLWRMWLGVVLLNVVIWFVVSVATFNLIYFWPIWVAVPWGAGMVALTIIFPPRRRPGEGPSSPG